MSEEKSGLHHPAPWRLTILKGAPRSVRVVDARGRIVAFLDGGAVEAPDPAARALICLAPTMQSLLIEVRDHESIDHSGPQDHVLDELKQRISVVLEGIEEACRA